MYRCIYFFFSTSGNPMTWLFLSNNSSYRFFQVSTDKIFLTRSLLNGCFLNVLFLYWVILISIILLHKYLHKCSSHAELSLDLPCGIWKGGFMAVYHSFLWWLLKRLFCFVFFLMLYHHSTLFIAQNKNHSYTFLSNPFMVSVLQSTQSKSH